MPNPHSEHREICRFTSKEWTGRPGDDAGAMFTGFAVIGFLVCLTLMLFIPVLRGTGATVLFVGIFAATFTALVIRGRVLSERAFVQRLTATVNEVILELTADRSRQLKVEELRSLLVKGTRRPLSLNGVSGMDLRIVRDPAPKQQNCSSKNDVVTTTRVVLAAAPPDYGLSSFDRLLETAVTDPEAGGS